MFYIEDMSSLFGDFGKWADPGSLARMVAVGAAVLGIASLLCLLIRRGVRKIENHFSDVTMLGFVSALSQMMTYLLGLMIFAHLIPQFNAIATALLAGVSIISVVVGIAAQGAIGNLVSGFSLVLSRTMRVGDNVSLATPSGLVSGKVHSISLAYSILKDDADNEIFVPNSVVMTSAVTRVSHDGAIAPDKK